MPPSIRFANAEIRPSERQLLIDGKPAALGSRAFDVLLTLVERRERLVRKNELLDLVWPDTVVEENNLQSQVSQLRKLLGPQAISTIPGRGYRFTATVDEGPPSGTAATPQVAGAPRDEASTPPTTTALRTNLPAVLPPLIGRDDDLLALGALIDRHRSTHRLVTIAGAGGIGKTRLAQTLLQARTAAFVHGVCFVDLAPVTDPRQVADSIATALGVPTAGGRRDRSVDAHGRTARDPDPARQRRTSARRGGAPRVASARFRPGSAVAGHEPGALEGRRRADLSAWRAGAPRR